MVELFEGMKIETRFNCGEKVFYLNDNKIVQEEIYEINITARGGFIVEYLFNRKGNTSPHCVNETKVFATKEELINSL